MLRRLDPERCSRDYVQTKGGLAAVYELALYNVLAAALILCTVAVIGLGDAALLGAGLSHASIGLLFVYALARAPAMTRINRISTRIFSLYRTIGSPATRSRKLRCPRARRRHR
jgi:hypothetical protein